MLEYVKQVKVIDISALQIRFVILRAEALRRGRYDLFLCNRGSEFHIKRRDYYFSKEGRIDKIRENLKNLDILEPSNIFSVNYKKTFSKIYLSNVLDKINPGERNSNLHIIEQLLSLDGLIYITNGDIKRLYTSVLRRDSKLTEKAINYDSNWFPLVLRRVEASK